MVKKRKNLHLTDLEEVSMERQISKQLTIPTIYLKRQVTMVA